MQKVTCQSNYHLESLADLFSLINVTKATILETPTALQLPHLVFITLSAQEGFTVWNDWMSGAHE